MKLYLPMILICSTMAKGPFSPNVSVLIYSVSSVTILGTQKNMSFFYFFLKWSTLFHLMLSNKPLNLYCVVIHSHWLTCLFYHKCKNIWPKCTFPSLPILWKKAAVHERVLREDLACRYLSCWQFNVTLMHQKMRKS